MAQGHHLEGVDFVRVAPTLHIFDQHLLLEARVGFLRQDLHELRRQLYEVLFVIGLFFRPNNADVLVDRWHHDLLGHL